MKNKILVAVPCFNCSAQIKRVVGEFDETLLQRVDGIIIIDNRSKDDTIESAVNAVKKIKSEKFFIFRNDENYGLGGSHKVAFNFALEHGYDYVVILHGDNQAKTQEINFLINEIEKDNKLGAILGSRFMLKSRLRGYSSIRVCGNVVLNILFTIFTMRVTKDLGSGLNIFKTESLKDKRYLNFSDNLTFNVDLLLDYFYKKTKILFYPITWSETDQISNAKAVSVAITALRALCNWMTKPNHPRLSEKKYTSTVIFNKKTIE